MKHAVILMLPLVAGFGAPAWDQAGPGAVANADLLAKPVICHHRISREVTVAQLAADPKAFHGACVVVVGYPAGPSLVGAGAGAVRVGLHGEAALAAFGAEPGLALAIGMAADCAQVGASRAAAFKAACAEPAGLFIVLAGLYRAP